MNKSEQKYSEKRKQRTDYAVAHTKEMEMSYKDEITNSIRDTVKFDCSSREIKSYDEKDMRLNNINDLPDIKLWDCGSVEALFKAKEKGIDPNPTILNFASFKYPGGGFIVGTNAQEENLCQKSNLYNILKTFDTTWYEWNRYHTNESLYFDRGLFSPDVIFQNDNNNETTKTNVITVACPNKNGYDALDKATDGLVKEKENSVALRSRIEFVLRIAGSMCVENLILGAFGCGVFKQDPEEVAAIFDELLHTYYYGLKTVIFAIPDKDSKNYKAFEKVLNYNED